MAKRTVQTCFLTLLTMVGLPETQVAQAQNPTLLGTVTTQVSADYTFTCALTTNGTVQCWGDNFYDQLGTDKSTTAHSYVPLQVPGLSGVVQVETGLEFGCALTAAGAVQCWGYNYDGELGNGTMGAPNAVPTTVSGLDSGVAAIAVGLYHACALMESGTVKCWGFDEDGELGNGDTTYSNSATPVDVVGLGGSGYLGGVASIAAGAYNTCVLLTSGTVDCWGVTATVSLNLIRTRSLILSHRCRSAVLAMWQR